MSDYDRFTTGVSKRQLGAIYRAYKDGKLDGITQRDISAMYDYFDGYTSSHEGGAWGWDDVVAKMADAAKNSTEGNYSEAAKTLRAVFDRLGIVKSDDTLLSALQEAVEKGLITVAKTAAGYSFSGATYDYKDAIKSLYGAKWDAAAKAWNVAGIAKELEGFVSASEKAAEKMAKRAAKVATDGLKEFDKQRAAQLRKVTKELHDVYTDALISRQEELNAIVKRLEAAQDPVEAIRLAYQRDELNAVIDALSHGLADAGTMAESVSNGQLMQARQVARDVAVWQIDNLTGVHVTRFLGDDFMAKALQSKFDKIAWRGVANPRAAKKTVKQQIARGLLVGENPRKIASRLKGLFTGDTPGSSYRRAVRIAQTETCRIMTEAAQDTFKAAEDMGLKVSNRWDATLDGKTRPSHREVDGEVRAVGEKFSNGSRRPGDGGPDEVINCRCCLTPVIDGWQPDAPVRRDNITGETITYQAYSEWAKSTNNGLVAEKAKAATSKPAIAGDVVKVDGKSSAEDVRVAAGKKAAENRAENAIIIEGLEVDRKNGGIIAKAGSSEVSEDTFFLETTAVYKKAKRPDRSPDHVSGSDSAYWYQDGGVYRESDHWGAGVSSCNWFMEGRNEPDKIYSGKYAGMITAKKSLSEDKLENGIGVGFCKFSDFAKNKDVLPTSAMPDYNECIKVAEEKFGISYEYGEVYKDGKRDMSLDKKVKEFLYSEMRKYTPVFYN